MIYDSDLRFLCETYKKSHINVSVLSQSDFVDRCISASIESALGLAPPREIYTALLASPLKNATMYRITDAFELRYIYFLLPGQRERSMLLVGPYVTEPPSDEWILKKLEDNRISPAKRKYINEYFSSIPVITAKNHIFDMLDTFCERIWQSPSFSIVDINPSSRTSTASSEVALDDGDFDDFVINMKAMEKRYAFENELIDAVAHGQVHKQSQLIAAFSNEAFELRTADRLRNAKNYAIIMNTLLRKAAERGGVHPIYIDRVSSRIAIEIEKMSSLSKNNEFMLYMFRTYCNLVHEHSIANMSPVVQKTVLLIDSDLSADLSLSAIAALQNVSSGYLSTVFKRETGKTLSEYVRDKRMSHAAHLLKSTNLQIQTIASHCGIVDVQYFTKQFKNVMGKSPSEYRASIT
ncbi:MAG: helix-turn-helix transcriptional regulator [Clostridia bacterium]|nr:helix-turn-helix transcriptional regulator [Clostridia bacterium]